MSPAGVVAGKAFVDFAKVEGRVNRIAINGGKGADQVQRIIRNLQTVAKNTKMGFDQTVEGVETLIASGRTLDEGLALLPSVATTAQASGAAISDIALSADALSNSLKISGQEMQQAFDVLVKGGKEEQVRTERHGAIPDEPAAAVQPDRIRRYQGSEGGRRHAAVGAQQGR